MVRTDVIIAAASSDTAQHYKEVVRTLTNSRMVSSLIFWKGVLGRHDDDVSVSFG